MKRYLLLGFFLCALLVLPVSAAWNIQSPDHTGTIRFYDNGMGIVHVDNYPAITFEYKQISGNQYEARYLWYSIPFDLNGGIITSSKVPGASATWSDEP